MVTTSVTYLEGSERCFVAHCEVVGVTHKGSDQAPLHGRRAGRGVRSQQAHDAQGPERALGDGCAFAFHAGSWGRVLVAAGRQEALAFFDRGRGARLDRLLRSPAQVPCAPLLDAKSLCGDQAASRSAQGGRGGARQVEEARIRGWAGARLRGPAPRRAALGGARRDTPEGYLRLDQVGDDHWAGAVRQPPLGEGRGHRAGRKSFELTSLFGRITPEEDGVIEVDIPLSEIDYYASRLLSVGTDIRVYSPQELVEAIESKAREIVHLYRPQTS